MWEWDRRAQGLALLLAAALIFACGIRFARWQESRAKSAAQVQVKDTAATDAKDDSRICVDVTGAVKTPGVYYFKQGERLYTAVTKAGPLPEADLDALNLARTLNDGEKIVVPKQGDAAEQAATAESGGSAATAPSAGGISGGKVNLNTATAAELDQLPGIGQVYAQRIVDYRTAHGQFRSVEDLQNVSGIGPKRYEQLKDLVTAQ